MNKQMVVTRIDGAKGSTVNFRNKPNGDVIDTIPFGMTVTVTQEQGEWSGFEWKGMPGWMQSRFLSEPSATAPVPGDMVTIVVSRALAEVFAAALSESIREKSV